jgi:exopolysaccharide production protein ExoZ
MYAFLEEKFEIFRGDGGHNIRAMEGMRGLAVSLVFLVHYVGLIKPWIDGAPALLSLANAMQTIGNTGVDLFFVLSGYLIYGALMARRPNFFKFMSRRIVRIYPAFLAVFAMYLVLSLVFPAENKIPAGATQAAAYLIENLLLLPGLFPIEPMITVAWSLSYEMLYYLAIPLLIGLFRLRDRSAGWRVAFFLTAAGAILIGSTLLDGPIRLIMFVAGILLYEARFQTSKVWQNGAVGIAALIGGLLATLLPVSGAAAGALKAGLLFVAFFLFCRAGFAETRRALPRALSWRPLRWLGNMSYSYYLLHGLALKAAFLLLPHVLAKTAGSAHLTFWSLLPVMFAWSLIPPALLFLTIERPLSLAPRSKPAAEPKPGQETAAGSKAATA